MKYISVFILILSIILSGCATTPEVPPTFIPKPTSCNEIEGNCLELLFDGENCTYKGPANLTIGPVKLLYSNESEENSAVNIVKHTGDETIQDMIDYIGKEPSSVHHPTWTRELGTWRRVAPGATYIWNGHLLPGIHTMVCATWEPVFVWFGGGFSVDE